MQPLDDRVLVRRDESETTTASGLHLPRGDVPATGTVVAVGPGKLAKSGKRMPLEVRPGDRVVIGRYLGEELGREGHSGLAERGRGWERLVLVREDQIHGVIVE